MKFIIKIISNSSKRLISLFLTLVFTGVIIVHLCGVIVSDSIIWALVTLISGNGAMTLFDSKKGDVNNNRPSEIG